MMLRRVLILVLTFAAGLHAQVPVKLDWQLARAHGVTTAPQLRSNRINDIVIHHGEIWLGTGRGLSRSQDGGSTWVTYTHEDGLPRGEITALTVSDSIIWVAGAIDSLLIPEGLFPAGTGLSYSDDDGKTWHRVSQPRPYDTVLQNLTYDIALHPTGVWIASFGGSLARSSDRGQRWQTVPPDSLLLDVVGNLNHLVFSVINAGDVLYAGTAGGVSRSADGGSTWFNFSHQNQDQPISGNFVTALGWQFWNGREYIWAATHETADPDEANAISISEDSGASWRITLEGEFVHNFAFAGPVAYVVSDNGLYRSDDFGHSWFKYSTMFDEQSGQPCLSEEYFCAGVLGNQLFVGGPDGLAVTANDGATWRIERGSVAAGEAGEPRTYAYPNPFSPSRHNQLGGDGHVRFQYNLTAPATVTVKVFDFAMELVAEVVSGKARNRAGNYFEIWDGKNTRGAAVHNGVYFYRIDLAGEGAHWGKVMVLD